MRFFERTKFKSLHFGVFATLFVSSKLLRPIPADPDSEYLWATVIGTFATFLCWFVSLLRVGQWVCERTKIQSTLGSVLATGAAVFAAVAGLLGHLGLAGASSEPLYWGLLLAGTLLPIFGRLRKPAIPFPFLVLFIFLIGLAVMLGAVPQSHSDGYMYHLVGPKLWYERSKIYFEPLLPVAYQCGPWEYLYLWGQILLGGPEFRGTIEGILFAQWTHTLVGVGGSILLIGEILSTAGFAAIACGAGIMGALSLRLISWTWFLPKNDWGAVLWCLMTLRLSVTRSWRLSGVFAGLAATTKLTSGFFLLPVFLLLPASHGWKAARVFFSYAVISSLPILFRNWIDTGNPVFPALNSLFNSPWLSQSLARNYERQQGFDGSTIRAIIPRLRLLFEFQWITLPIFGAGFWAAFQPQIHPVAKKVALLSLSGFVIFLFLTGLPAGRDDNTLSLRIAAPSLVLIYAMGAATLVRLASIRRRLAVAVTVLLVILFLNQTPFGVSRMRNYFRDAREIAVTYREVIIGGYAKAWLRQNTQPWDAIITTGDDQIYPLLPRAVSVSRSQPDFDWQIMGTWDAKAYLQMLSDRGFKYLLNTRHFEVLYWSRQASVLYRVIYENADAIAHWSPDGMIVDLKKLLQLHSRTCTKDRSWSAQIRP